MILKLDIMKAYDSVDRGFLKQFLLKFGFSKDWIEWINSCVSSPKILVLMNGVAQGFFSKRRGIRQSDPISPFLFIIMVEDLGRLISKIRDEGGCIGIKIVAGMNLVRYNY